MSNVRFLGSTKATALCLLLITQSLETLNQSSSEKGCSVFSFQVARDP